MGKQIRNNFARPKLRMSFLLRMVGLKTLAKEKRSLKSRAQSQESGIPEGEDVDYIGRQAEK